MFQGLSKRFKSYETEKEVLDNVLKGEGVYVGSRSYLEFLAATEMGGNGRIMKVLITFFSYTFWLMTITK